MSRLVPQLCGTWFLQIRAVCVYEGLGRKIAVLWGSCGSVAYLPHCSLWQRTAPVAVASPAMPALAGFTHSHFHDHGGWRVLSVTDVGTVTQAIHQR